MSMRTRRRTAGNRCPDLRLSRRRRRSEEAPCRCPRARLRRRWWVTVRGRLKGSIPSQQRRHHGTPRRRTRCCWSARRTEETFETAVGDGYRRNALSAVSPAVWAATGLGFLAIVILDLVVIARRKEAVTMRQATAWVIFYVALAGLFAVGLFVFRSGTSGSEFVAGYITEYSLSVDNLFLFIIIMARFAVPARAVDKVLYIGIVVSMLLRAVFIAAGAAAIAAASWVF